VTNEYNIPQNNEHIDLVQKVMINIEQGVPFLTCIITNPISTKLSILCSIAWRIKVLLLFYQNLSLHFLYLLHIL